MTVPDRRRNGVDQAVSRIADDYSRDEPRYAIRQVGAGWTVYDYRDLEPARLRGRLQIGLERAVAEAVAETLTRAARRSARAAALPRAA